MTSRRNIQTLPEGAFESSEQWTLAPVAHEKTNADGGSGRAYPSEVNAPCTDANQGRMMQTSPGCARAIPEAPGAPTSAIETTSMWLSQNDKKRVHSRTSQVRERPAPRWIASKLGRREREDRSREVRSGAACATWDSKFPCRRPRPYRSNSIRMAIRAPRKHTNASRAW